MLPEMADYSPPLSAKRRNGGVARLAHAETLRVFPETTECQLQVGGEKPVGVAVGWLWRYGESLRGFP